MSWFSQLGGTRHRSFVVFCVVMVALILFAIFIWPAPSRANAAGGCWTVINENTVPLDFRVGHRNSFCGDGKNFTSVNWSRYHDEWGVWTWKRWDTNRISTWGGRGVAPNGQTGVQYKTQVVWGLWAPCVYGVCGPYADLGSKVQVWANGQSQSWDLT